MLEVVGSGCSWPFDIDPDCEECQEWEAKAARNLEEYVAQTILRKGRKKK